MKIVKKWMEEYFLYDYVMHITPKNVLRSENRIDGSTTFTCPHNGGRVACTVYKDGKCRVNVVDNCWGPYGVNELRGCRAKKIYEYMKQYCK